MSRQNQATALARASGGSLTDSPWWSRSEGGTVKQRVQRNAERLDINKEWNRRMGESPRPHQFRRWTPSQNTA